MMLKESVIFSFAHLVVLFCSTTNALLAPSPSDPIGQSYIVGGHTVDIEHFPYQVSLETAGDRLCCGGSIISEKHVLTSCHCAEYPEAAHIRAGSSTWGSGGSLYKISKFICHENFKKIGAAFVDNIAILTVDPKFVFGTKQQPIKLFREKKEVPAKKLSTLTGYGIQTTSGDNHKHLQVTRIPMVDRKTCNSIYKDKLGWSLIFEDCVCAGEEKGGKGPDKGDGGGPLVFNGQQVGIASYSYGHAEPNIPAVYTRVAYFYDWIMKNTAE